MGEALVEGDRARQLESLVVGEALRDRSDFNRDKLDELLTPLDERQPPEQLARAA